MARKQTAASIATATGLVVGAIACSSAEVGAEASPADKAAAWQRPPGGSTP